MSQISPNIQNRMSHFYLNSHLCDFIHFYLLNGCNSGRMPPFADARCCSEAGLLPQSSTRSMSLLLDLFSRIYAQRFWSLRSLSLPQLASFPPFLLSSPVEVDVDVRRRGRRRRGAPVSAPCRRGPEQKTQRGAARTRTRRRTEKPQVRAFIT